MLFMDLRRAGPYNSNYTMIFYFLMIYVSTCANALIPCPVFISEFNVGRHDDSEFSDLRGTQEFVHLQALSCRILLGSVGCFERCLPVSNGPIWAMDTRLFGYRPADYKQSKCLRVLAIQSWLFPAK
ncbi:hypothetical protein RvY_10378-2 [Ramazzottius varieornatus]|uniref:Uncharacterized protein n=1 Tax=Ramazzottius varieornatus TaxID=947166 RepID=A0A1D1VCJ3_RAMVA|nr:hypothetical protein RvY_10378-2 [Ramazzottius varieornatus]